MAFVLPGIFSNDNPAPSASHDALHATFPDGARIEYEPESEALNVSCIETATSSRRIQLRPLHPMMSRQQQVHWMSPKISPANVGLISICSQYMSVTRNKYFFQ